VVAVLLLGCLAAALPRETKKKNNQDLDGIGADLEDFIRHRDAQRNPYGQGYNSYNRRVNAGDLGSSPGKKKSTLDKISDFLKRVLSGN